MLDLEGDGKKASTKKRGNGTQNITFRNPVMGISTIKVEPSSSHTDVQRPYGVLLCSCTFPRET